MQLGWSDEDIKKYAGIFETWNQVRRMRQARHSTGASSTAMWVVSGACTLPLLRDATAMAQDLL